MLDCESITLFDSIFSINYLWFLYFVVAHTYLIKVMFRKVMGDPPIGQIAFAFTTLGFLNALLMWPICVALYLTGTEIMPSDRMPWIILLIASILLLGK